MGLSNLGQTLTPGDVLELVAEDLCQVEHRLTQESSESVGIVNSIASHLNSSGGKRLRPTLLLLSCRLFRPPDEATIQLATVVEMIHSATLVHDDIIDAAQTRRGKPSANSLWGNHASVLAGDWLYMQAFQIALRQRDFSILDELIQLTQNMVEGELLQLERIGRIDLTEADYLELVDRKTACLFSTCARLGALVSHTNAGDAQRLAEYGWNLGIAFQLVDDLLDFTACESVLGKPVGNDLREGKITLPVIYALQNSGGKGSELIRAVLDDRGFDRVSFSSVLALLQQHCGLESARAKARFFAARARDIISGFPDSPSQRALTAVTALVTDREF